MSGAVPCVSPLADPAVRRWIEDGRRDPEGFWARAAAELPWFRPWDRVFEWNPPTFRWFIGGETNLAYNAVDRHVQAGAGDRAALIYFNERGDRSVLTYTQLLERVTTISAALRGLGVRKGDRITIYMPPSPESIALMLAIVRIGAMHSVVFAGFGAKALADRIEASGSRFVFAADLTYRKGSNTPLTPIVNEAVAAGGQSVERIVTLARERQPAGERRLSWPSFLALADGQSGDWVPMEANEPAFILATSGTTAKPKLAIHSHGGYQVHVHAMGRWVFGLEPADVWWATSDIGWIVGHSYMVYGPLLAGCTTIAFEGALDYPHAEANWRIAVEEYGATGIFTSPTAIRALMRYGDAPLLSVDHARLKRVVCAGEVLNAPAWDWLQNTILLGRVPVIDHMWQTETSGPVFGNPYGIGLMPIKPGSSTIPLAGIDAEVVNLDGTPCAAGEKGIMVITRPFPGLTAALWGEPDRYGRDYWEKIPGRYYTGDSTSIDEDGYVWFGGRADEIIKIAGHRIGTIEVESACLIHPAVAECGVVGRPDDTRGEVISAFVLLKHGQSPSMSLKQALLETIRHELGPVAVVGELNFVTNLPKTRSGKIMRRVLKAVILNRDPGDITTIEDEGSVEEARLAWQQMKAEISPMSARVEGSFNAFRVFEENGKISGRLVSLSVDDLSQGTVVIKTAFSSVNYKDALAATGAGKIMRRFPLVGGIDVSGIVASSTDARFSEGEAVLVTGYDLGVAHDGGYADYVRVPAEWVVKVPAGLSLADVMAIGTAGFTAALSVAALERNGLEASAGSVIVTGATGGVGSMAVQLLAARGYRVTALTGKDAEHDYLRSLGAADVLSRTTLQMGARPLEKSQWAGAVDCVGGETLAWLTRTMNYNGAIACSGLTGGTDLHTTVLPFILRGAKLLGIDSVMCPMETRLEVWQRLATDMKPASLGTMAREITMGELPDAFATLLKGGARGRYVVKF
ncbi:MAG TPA: acetate--CoA ligase [Vicinamibacterales bacterium]